MILRSILLENFGLYHGRLELDLAPRVRRGVTHPIVLIGGKNGVGKTTLLEAVRLALYGRRALGSRVGQAQYDEYLRSRIHRPVAQQMTPHGAAVGLEFSYAEDGVLRNYRVRRSWTARGRSVSESLLLEKDGVIVEDVPRDEWHLFLHDLIPPGVSQLFFFDGEKIQEIADGDHDEEHLALAVRGLLGVELISRLRTDLGLFLARREQGQHQAIATRLEGIVRDLALLEDQIAEATEDLGQISADRDSQARVAEHARRRFVAEGGELAVRRTQLASEADEVKRVIGRREADLRELAGGLLPFAVAPRLARAFRQALQESAAFAEASHRKQMVSALTAALKEWRKTGREERSADWAAAHWKDLTSFLKTWAALGAETAALAGRAFESVGDGAALVAWLDEADTTIRPRLEFLANELEALYARERDFRALLLRADGGESSVLLDDLRHAEQRVGATEATLRRREEDLKKLRAQQATLERERERLLREQTELSAAEQRASLAIRASRVLAEYEHRLLTHKLGQLRGEFVQCFNRLARKGDVVADIRIDEESFGVTLIDKAGRAIPKADLSAGEKQVYAIAILWALARTSGRALPMIIDTPLARLDSDHRSNLVQRYFPSVSHQVIMLSTDTEVDAPLLASLSASVSHSYHLEYDPVAGHTRVATGYFWDSAGSRGTNAPREVVDAV
ncbi:MAG TPA: DNA sulfur modification protein DndD [Gemmatimonadaceae bacterium]|nr:DNA sulfur modification protein DndD [Gemmatimonadaceae bacterium]